MKHLILRATLMLLLFVTFVNANAETYSGSCGDNAVWSLDTTTGELRVSGTGEMYSYLVDNYPNLPWYEYRESITKVVVEDGITNVGEWCFPFCSSLSSLEIASSVKSIGKGAFYSSGLVDVEIPQGVTSIGDEAFGACRLRTFKMPTTLRTLGTQGNSSKGVFSSGSSSLNIVLPKGVETLEDFALNRFLVTANKTIYIPNTVSYMGKRVFGDDFDEIIIEDGTSEVDFCFTRSDGDGRYWDQIFYSVKNIYIGNNVRNNAGYDSGELFYHDLQSITFGPLVSNPLDNGYNMRKCTNLKDVTCLSKVPFKCPAFSKPVHSSELTIHVPMGSKEAYMASSGWSNFPIDEVTSLNITLDGKTMAYCPDFDIDLTDVAGIEAFTVGAYADGNVILKKTNKVHAGQGVIIKGTPGTYEVPCVNLTDELEDSPLKGTISGTYIVYNDGNNYNYQLVVNGDKLQFNKVGEIYGEQLTRNQAYLSVPVRTNELNSIMEDDAECLLVDGRYFNTTIKKLVNPSINEHDYTTADNTIEVIEFVTDSKITSGRLISAYNSVVKAYALYDSETKKVTVHTMANKFTANTSLNQAFFDFEALRIIENLEALNTENVNEMRYIFAGCKSLVSLNIGSFNTKNVENMMDMFSGCKSIKYLDISNLNTTKLKSLYSMFKGCTSLESINLSGIDTQNVEGMDYLFSGCSSLTSLDLNGFNTSKVTSMYEMFYGCTSLESINLSGFDTQNVKNMQGMFQHCSSLTSLDVTNFDTRNVTNMQSMFNDCIGLSTLDISNFDTRKVTDMSAMLSWCWKLSSLKTGKNFIIGNSTAKTKMLYGTPQQVDCCAVTCTEATKEAMCEGTGIQLSYFTWDIIKDITIVDGDALTNTEEIENSDIIYTRTFNNTNWQALYVPFSMNYEDWAEDFEIARLNDAHQYDDDEDGTIDRTTIESIKLKAGSKTEPNTPYMIKAKVAGEKTITLSGATLYKTEELSYDVTSWNTRFTFTGTYSTVTNMATNGYYALAGGRLQQATSNAVTLSPMRWYLDVTDRNGNHQDLAKTISLVFDDGETTDISPIAYDTNVSESGAIYYLDGAYAGNDRNKLSKGVYVSDGKKIIIK